MRTPRARAALVGALLFACVAIAAVWYTRTRVRNVTVPVSAVTAPPVAEQTATPAPRPTATQKAVVFVFGASAAPLATPTGEPAPGEGSATVVAPSSAPQSAPTVFVQPGETAVPSYVLPPPPVFKPSSAPQIVAMSISSPVVHTGQVVSGTVETSTNVASVEARIGGYSSPLHKVGAGRFVLTYRVPYVPFFLKKTYTVLLIARNTRGDAVTTSFPITVR